MLNRTRFFETAADDEPLVSRSQGRRGVVCVAAAFAAVGCAALALEAWPLLSDPGRVRAWVESCGAFAPVGMFALVFLQVAVAVLPGEPVELAAGWAFGLWEGTLICLAGSLAGTMAIVGCVRAFGTRAADALFGPRADGRSRRLCDSGRLQALALAVFLVPGTPKDALTYALALTDLVWWKVAAITTLGRIPSIVSSTAAAALAAEGNWAAVVGMLFVVALIAMAGWLAGSRLRKTGR